MAVPYHIHSFEIPTATDAEVAAGTRNDVAVVPSNLGTAAQSAIEDFATSVQGGLADGAAQKSQNLADLLDFGSAQDNIQIGATFADVSTAQAANVAARNKRIRLQYRDTTNRLGGCDWKRMSLADLSTYPALSYFRSTDRFMPDGSTDNTNGGYWVLDENSVTPLMMGAIGNDVNDDTDGLEATHLYMVARGGGEIVIPSGTFRSTKTFLVPTNTTVRFVGWVKMTAVPSDNYDTALMPKIGASNFLIVNPQIDLNSVASMNGFIMRTGAHEGTVIGGVIKNGAHDKGGDAGGRGFNVESDTTGFSGRNIVITGVKIVNCYMGFAVRGGDSIKKSNIIINNITVEDCDVAYWLVGNTTGYPHDSDELQGIISNVTAYNCGLNSQYTNQDGAFVSDRGCNFKQSNIVLHNDASYGTINSVWHGNGAKMDVDITFYGAATNIFDLGPYKESDAGPAFENTIEQCRINVTVYGSVTDIIKTAAVGAGYAANTELRGRVGTVTSGRVVSSGYSTQASLLMDFYEETNSAHVRGLAAAISALTFATLAGLDALISPVRTGAIQAFGDISSRALAPTFTWYDLSTTSKDFQAKVDAGVWRVAVDATADSGLFDRDVIVYNDGTGTGQLFSGGTLKFAWGTNGVGFNAGTVSKPTVTGSRGGNAALASLLTGLATQGLITDSSTA